MSHITAEYSPTKYHIFTHKRIGSGMSVGEIIEENADISIVRQAHYSHSPLTYPLYGQYALRANRDTWTHFSVDEVVALDGIGDMLKEANETLEKEYPTTAPIPGIFVVRVENQNGRASTDPVHLQPIFGSNAAVAPDRIVEAGVGNIYSFRKHPNERILAAASVVLRQELIGNEEFLSVRAYIKHKSAAVDEVVITSGLPGVDVARTFLQMQRNAIWNSLSEPI